MEDTKSKLIGDVKLPLSVVLKRTFKYLKPHKWKVALALLLIVISVALDIIVPLIYRDIIDNLNSSNIVLKLLIGGVLVYFTCFILSQGLRFFETIILQRIGNTVVYDMRIETFRHIEKMSLDQFEIMPVGSLTTRVCNYTSQLSDLYTNQLCNLLRNFLSIVGVYAVMIYISPILALIVLGIALVVVVGSIFFRKRIARLNRLEKGYLSDLNTVISEDLSGMKVIQLFNKEDSAREDFRKKNQAYRDNRFKIMSTFTFHRPFVILAQYIGTAILFFLSAKLHLTAGSVVVFAWFLEKFFEPIQEISDHLLHVERAITASERLFNLMDVQPKVVDKKNAKEITHFNGKIEFRNVWFSYDNINWVLKDVSFVVEKGQTCAFVGATGAGKTTIFSLLTKAYVPQKGQILIDDIDINDIKVSSLRSAIGQMLQDVFLFSGTIKSNITLFDDKFTEEEINDACKYVNANYFIDKLPEKYEEKVVERGENFSQGQRQLLSFARTILHKPEILLLDEATANIDTETESIIQDSLNKMSSLGTMLVVAHRLSTIQKADQIICLQHGEIIETGTHNELLKNKNYYWRLYQLQFK